MERGYKYRIYPNKKQEEIIQKTFDCCTFVYNYFLNRRISVYEEKKQNINYVQCCKELTLLKQKNDWLKVPELHALQNSIKDLDIAFQRFFSCNNGYPKYKDNIKKSYRSNNQTCNGTDAIILSNNRIKLPKLGYVKIRCSQIPKGRIINATISQKPDGRYFISLCCSGIVFQKYQNTGKSIGIDLGIETFATFSDGTKIVYDKFQEKSEDKIKTMQHNLAKKNNGSKNSEKERKKISKLYDHIMEQRKDFLQKLTTEIVKKYDVICIEDLDVKSLSQTYSNVRNKRILDSSFGEFRRQLEYKCKWYGKDLRIVDRYYPSTQICHICGHRDGKKSLDIRTWICPKCNAELDRDINAAINILNEGLKL